MYLNDIKTALDAAKYHEDQAFLLAEPDKEEYDKILFHLRAYFWELYSIWDYILQNANSQTLKIKVYSVKRNFLDEIEKNISDYRYLEILKKFTDEAELKRIIKLRDYAHKWQVNVNIVAHVDNKVLAIAIDNIDKDTNFPSQIFIERNDLLFMQKLVRTLQDMNFFDFIVS